MNNRSARGNIEQRSDGTWPYCHKCQRPM